MLFRSETTSANEFRDNMDAHLRRLGKAKEPTILTRNRKVAAVMMSPGQFREYAEAREFMDTVLAIEQSRRQIEAGLGKPWDVVKRQLLRKSKAASSSSRKK